MSKMTQKEKEDWNLLYEYVRSEILGYKTDKCLSKNTVLRLRGLRDGKFMANKKVKSLGQYSFETILLTFKLCKFDILGALRTKEFKDEQHKINYIMIIIENNINNTVDMINRKKVSEEKGKNINVNTDATKAEYKKKTKVTNNKRINDLW